MFCGRQIGCVERAVAARDARALEGVIVRKGIGSARWLPAGEIVSVRREWVEAAGKPQGTVQAEERQSECRCMLNGRCAGVVTDWLLTSDSLLFAALEVSPGPLYRLVGRCAYACDFRKDEQSGSVIVPELLTWAQLKKQLGEGGDG